MKIFLILFFLGYDDTLTFYQAETLASREQCEQLAQHVSFDSYGDEFAETWAKCVTKDEIARTYGLAFCRHPTRHNCFGEVDEN